MLRLLPALTPDDVAEPTSETAANVRPHLISLPLWTPTWGFLITPGRAAPAMPDAYIPPPPPANDPVPTFRRRKCDLCQSWFSDRDRWLYHECRVSTFPMVVLWDFQLRSTGKRKRKCSPAPRAHTRALTKAQKARNARAMEAETLFKPKRNPHLPVLREECKGGHRPCPLVSCRAHAAFTINEETGAIKENFPHLNIYDDPAGPGLLALEALHGTCTYDVADSVDDGSDGVGGLLQLYQTAMSGKPIGNTAGLTLEQAARATGLSIERIRQVGAIALQEMRVKLRRLENAQPGRYR